MQFDVFISYAWTDSSHREWVRLLAACLRNMGFSVGIDAKVDYGNDLDGFMRKILESLHVLMIVDDNYVDRADNKPDSGVGMENSVIRNAVDAKPEGWLAPLLVRNKEGRLPKWLRGKNVKYFDFRTNCEKGNFPGAEQINDLWRWISELSPDKRHAVSLSTLRERACRVEKVDELRDPGAWANPLPTGERVAFPYEDAPRKTMTLGANPYSFSLSVSQCGPDSVYVYSDYVKAVGLVTDDAPYDGLDAEAAYEYITPGRTITLKIGQIAVLMNDSGCMCIVRLLDVTCERNDDVYQKPKIVFDYKILIED